MATLSAESILEPLSGVESASIKVEPSSVRRERAASRLMLFAGSVYDMLNPNTPGKAEMRNCDLKRAAMLQDRPRDSAS